MKLDLTLDHDALPISAVVLCLVFGLPDGQSMEALFLHEKDLDKNKGGIRGFDAAKSNAELEKILEEKRGDDDRHNGDSKEEEETPGKDKGITQHLNTHF